MSRMHCVKTWPAYFNDVKAGIKTAEIRLNDRKYAVGDMIIHQEYDPNTQQYSGDMVAVWVTHAVYGPVFGIEGGYVMMSQQLVFPPGNDTPVPPPMPSGGGE